MNRSFSVPGAKTFFGDHPNPMRNKGKILVHWKYFGLNIQADPSCLSNCFAPLRLCVNISKIGIPSQGRRQKIFQEGGGQQKKTEN